MLGKLALGDVVADHEGAVDDAVGVGEARVQSHIAQTSVLCLETVLDGVRHGLSGTCPADPLGKDGPAVRVEKIERVHGKQLVALVAAHDAHGVVDRLEAGATEVDFVDASGGVADQVFRFLLRVSQGLLGTLAVADIGEQDGDAVGAG